MDFSGTLICFVIISVYRRFVNSHWKICQKSGKSSGSVALSLRSGFPVIQSFRTAAIQGCSRRIVTAALPDRLTEPYANDDDKCNEKEMNAMKLKFKTKRLVLAVLTDEQIQGLIVFVKFVVLG